jgi:hypothetical protein
MYKKKKPVLENGLLMAEKLTPSKMALIIFKRRHFAFPLKKQSSLFDDRFGSELVSS